MPNYLPNPFDAKALTEDQLVSCLHEMRRRGWAAAAYSAQEYVEMFGGNFIEVEGWFIEHRDDIENDMCEVAREHYRHNGGPQEEAD